MKKYRVVVAASHLLLGSCLGGPGACMLPQKILKIRGSKNAHGILSAQYGKLEF